MIRVIAICTVAILVSLGVNAQETAATASEKALDSIKLYKKAWNTHDATTRKELLASSCTEGATYTDPTFHSDSRVELSDHIGDYLGSAEPGQLNIVVVSAVDFHHNSFRFLWEAQDAEGSTIATGVDFGEFDSDGKITKIVGFFGPIADKE